MTRRPQPGDYLAIRTHGVMAQGIRIGCAIGGTWSPYNHAAIVVDDRDGIPALVEANPAGVQHTPLVTYDPADYVISPQILTSWERRKIVAHAELLVAQGTGYGWLDIAALAAVQLHSCPAWLEERAKDDSRLVCSQVVTECWWAAGRTIVPGKDRWAVTPGDLALADYEGLAA